jgi:hypothetical protein
MTVKCVGCKTKQKIHIGLRTDATLEHMETIQRIQCNLYFKIPVPDRHSGVFSGLTRHPWLHFHQRSYFGPDSDETNNRRLHTESNHWKRILSQRAKAIVFSECSLPHGCVVLYDLV